jgi:hypothetical protein
MGLDEAAQVKPVHRSEQDTHATDIEGTETMYATKTQCETKVYSKSFHSRRYL